MLKLGVLAKVLIAGSLLTVTAALSRIESGSPELSTVAPTPEAGLAAPKNCTYFSDPFYTFVVGRFGRDCCNNQVAWGTTSPYSICGGCFPCVPPPQ